jgi:hypothetical protein
LLPQGADVSGGLIVLGALDIGYQGWSTIFAWQSLALKPGTTESDKYWTQLIGKRNK